MYSVFNYIQIHIYLRDFKQGCPPPDFNANNFFLICNEHLQKLQWACFSEIRRWGISCVCLRSALWKKKPFILHMIGPCQKIHTILFGCVFLSLNDSEIVLNQALIEMMHHVTPYLTHFVLLPLPTLLTWTQSMNVTRRRMENKA